MKLSNSLSKALISALLLGSTVQAHGSHHHHRRQTADNTVEKSNSSAASSFEPPVNAQNFELGQQIAQTDHARPLGNVNGTTNVANTTFAAPAGNLTMKITGVSDDLKGKLKSRAVTATTVGSTVLVIARDQSSAYQGYAGLNGYGIPYQILTVPKGDTPGGVTLPALNSSATVGNFGAIVILSEVSYDYGASGYLSALTSAQWDQLYAYQLNYGVRMVRIDVYPGDTVGATALNAPNAGCCADGVEQQVWVSNATAFPTAGLKTGSAAGMSTLGLYHYPASITNTAIATPFLQFAANSAAGFATVSTGGVINNINGRQQMVFFISSGIEFSATSNLLQHTWIHWATRGLYAGYRRINMNTQIDDMFLETEIYNQTAIDAGVSSPTNFRIRTADMANHKTWTTTIQKKMPTGSSYFIEIGHNGNGNIDIGTQGNTPENCGIGAIYLEYGDTPLEYQKPLGSGTNNWPATPTLPTKYPYTTACTNLDTLKTWFATVANRDSFAHLSHTFTHENENNATYYDIYREISWNQDWLNQTTLSKGTRFSPHGIIPPAITGLHNGDAMRAWNDLGITNVVGDNSRAPLVNQQNEHWPYITTVADNGFAGMVVIPRWALNIYYNCDVPQCTTNEWIRYSAGKGTFYDLLAYEKQANSRRLLGLHHDAFMFHQANLRQTDVPTSTINGVTAKYSLLQAWLETIVAEMTRITTWPMITLKHDDMGAGFVNRMTRDLCTPKMTWTISNSKITGVTVTANGNTCSQQIPVTVPGPVSNAPASAKKEQIGSDPLTVWVTLSGQPVSLTLTTPIAL